MVLSKVQNKSCCNHISLFATIEAVDDKSVSSTVNRVEYVKEFSEKTSNFSDSYFDNSMTKVISKSGILFFKKNINQKKVKN